ncbi:MAG: hypothetical protein V4642_12230 [Bacteroidota bacterium]
MKKYWSILSFVVLAAFVNSCETNTSPSSPAKLITVQQIETSPGYAWFTTERDAYTPQADTVALIKAAFKSDMHKIYLHVNPSCGCEGTQKLFPHFIRVVKDAAIADSSFKIYSMAHATDEHPETSQFTITQLPSIFITKNGVPMATIKDVLPGISVEQQILSALQK